MVYFFSMLFIIGYTFASIYIIFDSIVINVVLFLSGAILSLIICFSCNSIIKLIKDDSNRKIIIIVFNCLCLPKMKLILDTENTHFHIEKKTKQNENGCCESFRLFIINDYKNLVGIDLDESNIKQKPAKIFYFFNNIDIGKYDYIQLTNVLNNFIGSSGEYSNPLFFDINFYIKKNEYKYRYDCISHYMKFSEHFFTYHLDNPEYISCIPICFIIFLIILNFATIFITILLILKDTYFIRILVVFPIINIIFFILYIIYKHCFVNIFRIDCIYSRKFDKVFIGLVKYNKKEYINTFEYQIDNISRFILEEEEYYKKSNFNLKVIFKNNKSQQICIIKNKTQKGLEGLAYLLNERININLNNRDSNELIYS